MMPHNALREFLYNNCLSKDCYDIGQEIALLREDMQAGLADGNASLMMIPSFLSPQGENTYNGNVIVLDAGGTNLRVGYVCFKNGIAEKVEFAKYPLPGSGRALTYLEFFDAVAEKLLPYLDMSDKIGFCFSYAAECTENKDAKIIRFCKEVTITDSEGKEICRELQAAINRLGVNKKYSLVQLNDTVATLLGGMAVSDRSRYDSYIGCILGTGTNACYIESTDKIKKYNGAGYKCPRMIINMETGCYTGFKKGAIDKKIDASSALPFDHQAEKLVSGAYLGKIIFEALTLANKEGLLISAPEGNGEIPMAEVGAFLSGENSLLDCFCVEDKQTAKEIILSVFARTARLMAAFFGAVALHTDAGKSKPVAVIMEGSTYQKSPALQEYMKEELLALTKTYGIHFEVLFAENATLTGSAFAAISNT